MINPSKKIRAFLYDLPLNVFKTGEYKSLNPSLSILPAATPHEADELERIKSRMDISGTLQKILTDKSNFVLNPEITHPISGEKLQLVLPKTDGIENNFFNILIDIIKYAGDSEFNNIYIFSELLKEKLTGEETSLGPVWNKIPFDSAIPDHSAWHHSALISALSVCGNSPQLLSFSLGPMSFTRPSLTLREFWSSSMILSYLLWSGMRAVCEELGSEHILYPAISGQPLFRHWLSEKGYVKLPRDFKNSSLAIPSFSNSFVAIVPEGSVKSIVEKIEISILEDWKCISDSVFNGIKNIEGVDKGKLRVLWDEEINSYWVFRHASYPWLDVYDDTLMSDGSADISGNKAMSDFFLKICGNSFSSLFLYLPSHQHSQNRHYEVKMSLRAKEKSSNIDNSCSLCNRKPQIFRNEDKISAEIAWNKLVSLSGNIILNNEQLCPSCITRRLIHLYSDSLPESLKIVFQQEPFRDLNNSNGPENYIAILSMDGDRMGNLVKGKNENFPHWADIMNSSLKEAFESSLSGDSEMEKAFQGLLAEKVPVFPWMHQFLSESLADFSLITVPYLVKKYNGQIIYLGGDDVVAAFPVATALHAADEIRDFYRTSFVKLNSDGKVEKCGPEYKPLKGERLLTHPGSGVSMSAAVVFAHADEHAGGLLSFARKMLDDEAKDNTGRNALAVVLKDYKDNYNIVSEKWENSRSEKFTNRLIKSAGKSLNDKKSHRDLHYEKIINFLSQFV